MKKWLFLKARFQLAGIFLGLALLFSQVAFAADVEMLHVLRPKSDLLIKIETVLNARKSIDFITYHHDNTESSALLMEALRLAALRGVHVRYIYDTMATRKGASDFSAEYLARLQQAGVEVRAVTLWDRITTWGPFKLIHSKVLIADAGDSEVAILGGRNVGDRYMDWLDNTFVLRYRKGTAFSSKMESYFTKVWSSLRKISYQSSNEFPKEAIYPSESELKVIVDQKFGSAQSTNDLQAYQQFLKDGDVKTMPSFHFDFSEISFVTSGMINQINREKRMDEISSVFDEIAAESKSLEISTILFYLSPQKRDVLKRFLLRKGELTVSTNNLDTFSTVLGGKKGTMGTTLEKMQEKEFADLSKVGGKVQTYAVNYDDFTFNHAKYVIGDKSVLLTSSNFNYSSDLQAEENGLYIRSEAFANYMRKYNEDVRFKYFKEIDYDHGARLNLLEKSCKFVLKNVF